MKAETLCIHLSKEQKISGRSGVNTPIETSSAFRTLNAPEIYYPRYFNTLNHEVVARKISALEGGSTALIFSSGMAAISTALFAVVSAGDHVLFQNELYGGTHYFALSELPQHGIDVELTYPEPGSILQKIRPNTKLIYLETPSNPLLSITDLGAIAQIAKKQGIITIVDNTFATPLFQKPLELGIDIVIHSGTKYLGGHSDLCCGVVVSSQKWMDAVRHKAINLGGCLDAQSCYLLERSLKTLVIRVERQTQNAQTLAEALEKNANIARVYYPGLTSHPGHTLAKKQMTGFGAMLSFDVASHIDPSRFLQELELIAPALSLGGVESTICQPITSSHSKVSKDICQKMGITAALFRLSVGIEHQQDLISDLFQALEISIF